MGFWGWHLKQIKTFFLKSSKISRQFSVSAWKEKMEGILKLGKIPMAKETSILKSTILRKLYRLMR